MRKSSITIYDLNMKKLAMLENATNIGYETPMNTVWSASFEMPLDDPKNEYCRPFHYVELWDGNERLELFRILPQTAQRTEQTQVIKYTCEHVLATLLDDVLFQYHQIGNLGVYTSDVLQYILSKQTTERWQLGTVDFARQFEYSWENAGLLAALFSVPKVFAEDYQWTFDTRVYPWKLNLVRPAEQVQAYIRYGKNMRGISKTEDPSNLVNRIYALGYGEGVNQLNFADINGGLPYIQDNASITRYGVKAHVWADRRFTSAETLLARSEAMLAESKDPRLSYTVSASELYALTSDPVDRFRTGTLVRVQDPDIGDVIVRVVNVSKRNVRGAPGDVELEIANRQQTISGTFNDLQNRMKIEEVNAQGATNLYAQPFADNCDPTHPAVLRVWVPEETARVNKLMLFYEVEAFRGYTRSLAAAPSTSSGPSSTSTTASNPTQTSGPSSLVTTGPSSKTTTSSGGGSFPTTRTNYWRLSNPEPLPADFMELAGDPPHAHAMTSVAHVHDITIDPHSHEMDHTHGMEHVHSVPGHTHDMPHTHQIPAHTHGIEHGIYEGPTPTGVTLRVDGNEVPGAGVSGSNVDLVPFLEKDDEGKIKRGAWHTISIVPNSLGRIVASVVSQVFVQSRGGGNY